MFENTPLPHKIHMLAHIIEQRAGSILQESSNVAFNSYVILHVVQKQGEMNQQHLAKKMQLTTAAISKRIKLLVEKELITSITNEKNRREHLINITEKGKKTYAQATELLTKSFDSMIQQFENRKEFEQHLNKLLTIVCSDHHDNETC